MYCIIVAAGSGTRMGVETPKQFLPLNKVPMFMHSMNRFLSFDKNMHIVLVVSANHSHIVEEALKYMHNINPIQVVEGGNTRFQSVRNGLQLVPDNTVVFIHDAARPFVHEEIIQRCYTLAREKGNAIPAIGVNDSFRLLQSDGSISIDRTLLRAVQTPQTFQSTIIKKAYALAGVENFTDDASVLEANGYDINLVEGDAMNRKITTLSDYEWAQGVC